MIRTADTTTRTLKLCREKRFDCTDTLVTPFDVHIRDVGLNNMLPVGVNFRKSIYGNQSILSFLNRKYKTAEGAGTGEILTLRDRNECAKP